MTVKRFSILFLMDGFLNFDIVLASCQGFRSIINPNEFPEYSNAQITINFG